MFLSANVHQIHLPYIRYDAKKFNGRTKTDG